MSFLRKRSRSQCSYRVGDEELSVYRKESQDVARASRVDTISSDVEAPDINDSCVARKVKHKASQLRFLTWVAYTRVYDEEITEDEKRICPLLWCRTKFKNQEIMLQHVWNCQHLSKGMYWCFHCQKSERVGKTQCKRCQGLPTRVDRVASVARRIFSKLGTKSHRTESPSFTTETEKTLEDVAEALKLSKQAGSVSYPAEKRSIFEAGPVNWVQQDAQELPNTSVVPELECPLTASAEQFRNCSYPNMAEMVGSEPSLEPVGVDKWTDNFYAENWDAVEVPQTEVFPKPRGKSPKLSLDTSVPFVMAEDSYIKEVPACHFDWTMTPNTDTLSPLSPAGGVKSLQFAELDLSPTDSVASGKSFFSDSGYSSGTAFTWSFSANGSLSRNSSVESRKGKAKALEKIPEEWTRESDFCARPVALPTPPSIASLSRNSSTASHSANRCTEIAPPPARTSSTIVKLFSEVLDESIKHTKARLEQLPISPLITELLSQSRTSMVSIGLDALVGILEGRSPGSIAQAFAFAHVACAAAISIEGEATEVHTQSWFQDSLVWVPERQRPLYQQIAKSVWEPFEMLEPVLVEATFSRRNSVLVACQHFLHVFESARNHESNARSTTEHHFNFAQAAFERNAKIFVIDELIRTPTIEAFIEDVVQIEKRLMQGHITSIRGLELELICSSKQASQSDLAYQRFEEQVTQLCQPLYDSATPSSASRAIQHISLIKDLIPEEDQTPENEAFINKIQEQQDMLAGFDFDLFEQDPNAALGFEDEVLFTAGFGTGEPSLIQHGQQEHPSAPFPTNFSPTVPTTTSQFLPSSSKPTPYSSHPHTPPPVDSSSTPTASLIPLQPQPLIKQGMSLSRSNSARNLSLAEGSGTSSQPSTASPLRCHCGYMPTGEEKWKASNLRRHKRTQHPVEAKTYPCPYSGCESSFTRSDNLRDHQRRKGHEVPGHGLKNGTHVKNENGSGNTSTGKGVVEGVGSGSGSFKRRKLGIADSYGEPLS